MIYIVIEIQTNADGTIGNLVYSYTNINDAESQYHRILAAAAISNLPTHAAIMLNNYGDMLKNGVYIHGGE